MKNLNSAILEDLINNKISDALFKTSILVQKIDNNSEFLEWINNELNGYKGELPNYRIFKNLPLTGTIANIACIQKNVNLPTYHLIEYEKNCFTEIHVKACVSEIEEAIKNNQKLGKNIPPEFYQKLSEPFNGGFVVQSAIVSMDALNLHRVLNEVRNIIKDYIIKLPDFSLEAGFSTEAQLKKAKEITEKIVVYGDFINQPQNSNIATHNSSIVTADGVEKVVKSIQDDSILKNDEKDDAIYYANKIAKSQEKREISSFSKAFWTIIEKSPALLSLIEKIPEFYDKIRS